MVNNNNTEHIEIPTPETDYHGHPHYFRILVYLMSLMTFSLIVGYFVGPVFAIILIFAAAAVKASLVVKNFMHLGFEPILIWIAVAAVLFCLTAFFFGIYPDITASHLDVVPR
ncbi:MAG: hypothetical protein U0T75_12155 [Chitinophagales bacterium]